MRQPDQPDRAAMTVRAPQLGTIARIYRAAFPIFFSLAAPAWMAKMIRRGGWREKFSERFGRYAPSVPPRRGGAIVHAVSVGEMLLGIRIAQAVAAIPDAPALTLATTTTTGMARAAAAGYPVADRIYLPIDFPRFQRRMLAHFRPRLFVSVEAAPWPNLLHEALRCGVKVAILNARVSPRSRSRYLALRAPLGQMFQALDAVGITDPEDREFWLAMGVPEARVHLTGNVKFDASPPETELVEKLRAALHTAGLGRRRPILLAGSTFRGEERIMLEAHLALRKRHPDLLTLLVPRHVERAPEILSESRRSGIRLATRSAAAPRPDADALLVDTTGELRGWYAIADAVFIGKSLCAKGGQNPVEAAVAGKRPIFGPHMENFQRIADQLVAADLAVRIAKPPELASALEQAIGHAEPGQVAARVAQLLAPHRGAAARNAELLAALLA